ncbi:hypothetical protein NHX12_024420 [Muraenolepis orangiensis]|uniref:Uncharacterized protein n=1 Tax=Muraenolepis orangiensis TaxID=630683 RepID=A0A9Q0EHG3_9TELE|nr:hypothetical protein NHX12_024420 [Muraenolepis orangiensis]
MRDRSQTVHVMCGDVPWFLCGSGTSQNRQAALGPRAGRPSRVGPPSGSGGRACVAPGLPGNKTGAPVPCGVDRWFPPPERRGLSLQC